MRQSAVAKKKNTERNGKTTIQIAPHGGWLDVCPLAISGKTLYFIISAVMGRSPDGLLRAHPHQSDPENADHLHCCDQEGEYGFTKATFTWNEEGAHSTWVFEREAGDSPEFALKIQIDICREKTVSYRYSVDYGDFCYAVAKAYTDMLKEYGFWGYHHSTHTGDICVRYLLFLKAVALGRWEARALTHPAEGHGSRSDLDQELALLLADM